MNTFKQYGRLVAALALLAIFVLICVAVARYGEKRYAAGVEAGRNAVLVDDARAAKQVADAKEHLASISAAAGAQLQQRLDVALPAIQGKTHDTVETIRTIYRDRPVPIAVECSRPDGVQVELDAAVDRANRAITADDHVRSDAPAGAAATRSTSGGGR